MRIWILCLAELAALTSNAAAQNVLVVRWRPSDTTIVDDEESGDLRDPFQYSRAEIVATGARLDGYMESDMWFNTIARTRADADSGPSSSVLSVTADCSPPVYAVTFEVHAEHYLQVDGFIAPYTQTYNGYDVVMSSLDRKTTFEGFFQTQIFATVNNQSQWTTIDSSGLAVRPTMDPNAPFALWMLPDQDTTTTLADSLIASIAGLRTTTHRFKKQYFRSTRLGCGRSEDFVATSQMKLQTNSRQFGYDDTGASNLSRTDVIAENLLWIEGTIVLYDHFGHAIGRCTAAPLSDGRIDCAEGRVFPGE